MSTPSFAELVGDVDVFHRHHLAGAWFSLTARMNAQVKTAIAAIDLDAWKSIKYPNAVWEEAEGRWVSDAEVAEIELTCFTSRRKTDHITCWLIVTPGQAPPAAGQRRHRTK